MQVTASDRLDQRGEMATFLQEKQDLPEKRALQKKREGRCIYSGEMPQLLDENSGLELRPSGL